MGNSNDLERLWKLQTQVNKLILDGKRTPRKLLDALQGILEEGKTYQLYLHPNQDAGQIQGLSLDYHLKQTGLINRALSLKSPLIKGWLSDPSTYPNELKEKAVFLWGSQQDADDGMVDCLIWDATGKVLVSARQIVAFWTSNHPALLELAV